MAWLRGNPLRLLKMVSRHGMDVRCSVTLLIYLLKACVFFPAQLYEYLFLSSGISRHRIETPPVFIIGHFRSGTTLLHKLLAADPQFTFFRNFELVFPGLKFPGSTWLNTLVRKGIKALKVPNFAYNQVVFDLDDPQEEDMCMVTSFARISYYWLFVFPRNAVKMFPRHVSIESEADKRRWKKEYLYFLKRISQRSKGRRLLLKNPPNMARIGAILELFPDARIIFLNRNPKDVLRSTKRIWRVGTGQFSLQKINEEMFNPTIIEIYARLHSRYSLEKHLIPSANLVEIKYEDLERNPSLVIREIYSRLGLSTRDLATVDLKIKQENLYSKFRYSADPEFSEQIDRELATNSNVWNS